MPVTETAIPANTPAAVTEPAAVAQSPAPASPATPATPPAPQSTTQPTVPVNPFDPDYLQARVDAYLASKKGDATVPATGTAAPAAQAAQAPAVTDAAAPAQPGVEAPAVPAATATDPAAPATTDAAATAPVADTAPDAALIVELPPRNAGGEPVRIAAPDKATADAIKRLHNGYLRGEEYIARMADVEQQLERVQEVEIMLRADPVGLVERMPEQNRVNVARALLAEHFEALKPEIEAWWNDDSIRRNARADGIEAREGARQSFQQQSAVARQVRDVANAVRALVPEMVAQDEATEFFQEGVRFLASVAQARPSGVVTPQEVPQLLAKRVARYGFTKPADTTAPTSTVAAPATAPASPAATPQSAKQPDVARVLTLNQGRAAAAASTTVGAGATPVTALPKPPKGLTIEQTADHYLKLMSAKGA